MISYSMCPDYNLRTFQGTALHKRVESIIDSVRSLPKRDEASKGAIAKALHSSRISVYVTSSQYSAVDIDASMTCYNVNVKGQDYRLLLGFNSKVVRVELLSAGVACHRSRKQADFAQPADAADVLRARANVARNQSGGDDPYNNVDDPYNNNVESLYGDESARRLSNA
jgi:hypothetical protein